MEPKTKILITLATGKTGYATALLLIKEGHPVKIYVRSRNKRALELEKMGAEIAIGTFDSPAQLLHALQDVKAVYYCYPIKKGMPGDVACFINAAKKMSIETVVFMGQWLAEFNGQESIVTLNVQQSYSLLQESGLNVIYLIPGYFVENTIGILLEFAVQLGVLTSPFGKGKNPVVSNEDLAACIAALLKNPKSYYGKKLRPTGPKSLSTQDMAAVISRVTNKKVRVINIPEWMFLKAAFKMKEEYGYDSFIISQGRLYNIQYRENKFDAGGVTGVVKELTGKEPDNFETIVKRLIAQSAYGLPSHKGWLRAMAKFMAIPFQPVPTKKQFAQLNKE